MGKFLELLTRPLIWFCEKTGRYFYITGTDPTDVYLIRYYVVRSKYFNFFIHIFLRSDRDDLHDHPWNFCTYLVRGAYTEDFALNRDVTNMVPNYRDMKRNRFVTRKAEDLHRVIVKSRKFENKNEAPMTLFFSGPVRRDWGFVKLDPVTKEQKWIFWKTYLGLPLDAPSRG